VTTLLICTAVCALTTLADLLDAACPAATGMKADFGVTSIDSITPGDGQSWRTYTVPPFGAAPGPDGLTADGAQNRMLRASEMAVRQRSQMPLMVRQISLCPGLACPGLAALPSRGEVISEGGCGACSGSALQSHPVTIALWHRGRLGER